MERSLDTASIYDHKHDMVSVQRLRLSNHNYHCRVGDKQFGTFCNGNYLGVTRSLLNIVIN